MGDGVLGPASGELVRGGEESLGKGVEASIGRSAGTATGELAVFDGQCHEGEEGVALLGEVGLKGGSGGRVVIVLEMVVGEAVA